MLSAVVPVHSKRVDPSSATIVPHYELANKTHVQIKFRLIAGGKNPNRMDLLESKDSAPTEPLPSQSEQKTPPTHATDASGQIITGSVTCIGSIATDVTTTTTTATTEIIINIVSVEN
ncbi:unnamed protein product [Echinostoma caproni]|uniref:BIG2 domain-containing protein n=1 Tax=Echinostoma caproni TaxID=27848 RepID=A0A183AMK5_9TREM|nr:unnamed protein product [Echinostoma caproni]